MGLLAKGVDKGAKCVGWDWSHLRAQLKMNWLSKLLRQLLIGFTSSGLLACRPLFLPGYRMESGKTIFCQVNLMRDSTITTPRKKSPWESTLMPPAAINLCRSVTLLRVKKAKSIISYNCSRHSVFYGTKRQNLSKQFFKNQ